MADTRSFDDRDGWIWLDGKLVPWREAETLAAVALLALGLTIAAHPLLPEAVTPVALPELPPPSTPPTASLTSSSPTLRRASPIRTRWRRAGARCSMPA